MKKLAILIAAVLLVLIGCAAAFANDTAVELYNSTTTLLFDHNNMTMNASVEFSLDGQWFKTADITMKQDGNRTYHKLHLRSPKKDGTERENGYTIVAEGNALYLMEDFTPGIFRCGTVGDRRSALRNTVESQQLIDLGRALISQADLLLGKDAITKTADRTYRIKLDEHTPELVNGILNEAIRFAAKRYFNLNYDLYEADGTYSTISNYGTTTQGILFCMRGVKVRNIEITVETDENGYPAHAEGTVSLALETAEEGARMLDITFKAESSDIGRTMLKKFDPKDYNVTLAKDSFMPIDGEEVQPAQNEALNDQMCLEAMEMWQHTGFDMVSSTSVSCEWNGNYFVVRISGAKDGIAKETYFDENGRFCFIQATPAEWIDGVGDLNEAYDFETGLDAETDKKAQDFFMEYLDNIHYARKNEVKDLQVQWTYMKNGSTYAMYEDKAEEHDGGGVCFVIRISAEKEMRIEDFHPILNG